MYISLLIDCFVETQNYSTMFSLASIDRSFRVTEQICLAHLPSFEYFHCSLFYSYSGFQRPRCIAAEDSYRLEIKDVESRGIVICIYRNYSR